VIVLAFDRGNLKISVGQECSCESVRTAKTKRILRARRVYSLEEILCVQCKIAGFKLLAEEVARRVPILRYWLSFDSNH